MTIRIRHSGGQSPPVGCPPGSPSQCGLLPMCFSNPATWRRFGRRAVERLRGAPSVLDGIGRAPSFAPARERSGSHTAEGRRVWSSVANDVCFASQPEVRRARSRQMKHTPEEVADENQNELLQKVASPRASGTCEEEWQ
jgi:hypothetical protein